MDLSSTLEGVPAARVEMGATVFCGKIEERCKAVWMAMSLVVWLGVPCVIGANQQITVGQHNELEIVTTHNNARRSVQPAAADMAEMVSELLSLSLDQTVLLKVA